MATELCPLCAQSFEAKPGETVCPDCASMGEEEVLSMEDPPAPPAIPPPPEPPVVVPPPPEPPRVPSPPSEPARDTWPPPQPMVHGNRAKAKSTANGCVWTIVVGVGLFIVALFYLNSSSESDYQSESPVEYRPHDSEVEDLIGACVICKGTRTNKCEICKSGKQFCEACGRDGRLNNGKRCITCAGTGVLPRQCIRCKGTTKVPCIFCNK